MKYGILGISTCLACLLPAAPITWGPATAVSTGPGNSADVSTNGFLVEAFNAQGALDTPATPVVNSVPFVGVDTILPGGNGTADDFWTAGVGGDNPYLNLLKDVDFGGGTNLVSISIGSGNLTVGSTYEVQVWFVDDRAAFDTRVTPVGDGEAVPSTVDLNDQYAIGTFIADGTSQTLTLDSPGFGNAHISAYQLREVPSADVFTSALLDLSGRDVDGLGLNESNGTFASPKTFGPTTDFSLNDVPWSRGGLSGSFDVSFVATGSRTNIRRGGKGAFGTGDSSGDPSLIAPGDSITLDSFVLSDLQGDLAGRTIADLRIVAVHLGNETTGDGASINGVKADGAGGGDTSAAMRNDMVPSTSAAIVGTGSGNGYSINGIEIAFEAHPNSITWGPATDTTGKSQLVEGPLVTALSAGVGATVSNGGASGTSNYTFAEVDYSDLAFEPTPGARVTADISEGATSTGDTDFDTVLKSFADSESGITNGLQTIGGLSAGTNYLVQVFYNDQRAAYSSRVMTFGDGQPTPSNVDVAAAGSGWGQHAIGSFTAVGPSVPLSHIANGFGNVHFNAILVVEAPPGPTATLATASGSVSGPFTVDLTFSESVIGLEESDFNVTNGSVNASSLSGSGDTWSFEVTPTAAGAVQVNLPAGTVTNTGLDANSASNTLIVTYTPPDLPEATLYGVNATAETSYEVFLTFSEEVTGLADGDFQITNGTASGTTGSGRWFSTTITANAPGAVSVTLPAGSVTDLDGDSATNPVSNTLVTQCNSDFGARWTLDDQFTWNSGTDTTSNLTIVDGLVTPTADSSQFTSIVASYPIRRRPASLTLAQSPVWDNWTGVANVGPAGAGDAPVLVPVGNDNYYFLGLGGTGGYHAWHSTDMTTWTERGPVTPPTTGRWVTSAEYKDGEFYIYSDYFNDHTPRLFKDSDLDDGVVGTDLGSAFVKSASGSDCALIRSDTDDLFHLIYEDWSPINASTHSWDSPLAGHTSSSDGLTGFYAHEHPYPVDHRTTPTGTFGTYNHPNVPNISYEIHTPEQDAFGDWTAIKIGSRFYLFGDYDEVGAGIKVARFTSDSIYKEFDLVGSLGSGHPDPTVGFAEGQFYLITQQSTDFVSPGPWVDGVEARAGVDTDGDSTIDQWTAWQPVAEQYDHTAGYIRVVTLTPAQLDLSALPSGYGFQFEFRIDDTVVATTSPIMDQAEMAFVPTNYESWAESQGAPVNPLGDSNFNGIPDLVEFALGQATPPQLQPDGSLTVTTSSDAAEDGYTVEIEFSETLAPGSWQTATALTTEVTLVGSTVLGNSDVETEYDFDLSLDNLFWRFVVR
ncbi:hypothetical protein HAHE_26490 [Haloferula helveola]|uniref:Bacterial Ig-like domain-containing protein n=1 Tax=Haloferula helveola TaxID=490095 RepID=A0ABM7RLR9_9BACT|nr:hypothetical protein HAHE_26490 [Haloferula helveola]